MVLKSVGVICRIAPGRQGGREAFGDSEARDGWSNGKISAIVVVARAFAPRTSQRTDSGQRDAWNHYLGRDTKTP